MAGLKRKGGITSLRAIRPGSGVELTRRGSDQKINVGVELELGLELELS
jgi:hypothetical protein